MKNDFFLIFIFLNLFVISIFGQDLKINISKPVLRQHQETLINIDFPIIGEIIKKQTNNSFDITKNNSISTVLMAKDTGEFQIGPFEIIFDNKKLLSKTAKVKVLPPIESKSGIYINSYYINERNIVVVEQVYKAEIPKSDKNIKQYTYSFNMGNVNSPDFSKFIDIENKTKVKIKITPTELNIIHFIQVNKIK